VTGRTLVRAYGIAAALLWSALALAQKSAWPRAGLVGLAASAIAVASIRPLALGLARVLLALPGRVFVGLCAAAAFAVSWSVAHFSLRDTPLGIDAGVYMLQARAMSHLHFGLRIPLPVQAFSDRFLSEGPDRLFYGVFPPGWPLAVVPFLWLHAPVLVGPAIAAAMVGAQAMLGRALGRAAGGEPADAELATRTSLVLALPSYARALETADPMSHGLVAVLASVALALAIRCDVRASPAPRMVPFVLGASVGWAVAARLLDGLVLAAGVAFVFVLARRLPTLRSLGSAVAGALPFLALLAIEQRCATGAWLAPTQVAYFARSDWPPTCHRLGFGRDIGCSFEHKGLVAQFGPDGYGPREALRVVRERASLFGEDILGFGPLVLLAFVPLAIGMSWADAAVATFVLGLTLAYGLFYFGNAEFFGARHLFPAAPVVWVLVARGALKLPHRSAGWWDARHARGATHAITLCVAATCAVRPWKTRGVDAAARQASRSDLRRTLTKHGVDRGILKTGDGTAVASAMDPWSDGDRRMFVLDDGSGIVELRRAHPELPVFLALPGDEIGKLFARRPPLGVLVELERTWPTLLVPSGLGATPAKREGASGGTVLLLSHATPGAAVTLPFDVAVAAVYDVRIDGIAGPDDGNYALTLDGEPLPDWSGYSEQTEVAHGATQRRTLTSGRHVLVARCLGRDEASHGFDAELDAFVGEPAGAL
jgi:hypothetical protein